MEPAPAAFAQAREQLLAMVDDIRPQLHRYCARLTGSVIEGEDIVQDTLAKALYALSQSADVPPLRPWLFRIAHNTALDFLKSHGHKLTDARDDLDDVVGYEDRADPAALRAALSRFIALPIAQRSAVILKDVLGHSLEDTAETMAATVPAVKAALARGRTRLAEAEAEADPTAGALHDDRRAELDRYAALFNMRDWDGVRALVGEDCRLDLVSKSQRRGKAVGAYFSRYEKAAVRVAVARLDGELVLAAFPGEATVPSYFILMTWDAGQIQAIRDFRYVTYIAADASYELV
ncbi:MAG TPA: sigma-70 family RNA polymerase sigma factor [Kofleriaceae bacterium]|jgi:RNA polymerase sigma-70 factor (ECF subfamily)|nr:sigma-70 family RNA polymerase sigma factor [Kofleriaceae bacterium]